MDKKIKIFVASLPETPGWLDLSATEQSMLQEQTSEFVDDFRQAGMKVVSSLMRLGKIDEFLKGKSVNITNWMVNVGPAELNLSERACWNLLAAARKAREIASDRALAFLAEKGIGGMNNVGINRLLPVLEKNPPPKDPKLLNQWGEKVGEDLREGYKEARRKARRLDPNKAMGMWVKAGIRILAACKMENSAAEKAWITTAGSYLMHERGIRGTIAMEKVPPPSDFLPRVGAPRGPRKSKDKAA
jgi:hypothetical protein